MTRPRGQGLLGGALGVTIVLLAGACGGDADEAAPAPEPTVEIAAAPTATSVAVAESTATPAPTATPDPTAAPEMTVEEEVIAAWERYWDLAVQARGENPSPEALALETYVGGELLSSLRETLAEQEALDYFVIGTAVADPPVLDLRDDALAILDGCVTPDLRSIAIENGELLASQDEARLVRGRVENTADGWRVTAVEIGGDPC